MDERLKFVARRLAGEPMSDLFREFGMSRKTGYKIFDRYQQCGCRDSPIAAVVPVATPTNFLFMWENNYVTYSAK